MALLSFLKSRKNAKSKTPAVFPLATDDEYSPPGNRYKYYPAEYVQDSSKSLTNGTKYDMTRISAHEHLVIEKVISETARKYPPRYAAIGFANECQSMKYKPRYIVFELLILKYKESLEPLDRLAVAFAYAQKGARFRQQAIKYFESAVNTVSWNEVEQFASLCGLSVYSKFSDIYEQEHIYDKAIDCVLQAAKYADKDNPYFAARVVSLQKKLDKPPARRPRTMSADQAIFENQVRDLAVTYLPLL